MWAKDGKELFTSFCEVPPLMHSKVPKSQPITQLWNVFLTHYSTWVPPWSNGNIHFLHFLLNFAFSILMTKPFVLFLKVGFNQTSYVHLHGQCPMHETCAFSTNHGYCKILGTKHPPHYIEICLGTIHHEASEVDILYYAYLLNKSCKGKPHEDLWINIFILPVAYTYSQYFAICQVINMTTHGSLTLNMFHTIKHHPHIFKVSF